MTAAGRARGVVILGALLALGWAALVAVPHLGGRAGALDGAEAALTDLRFRSLGAVDPGDHVAIVAIDDATLADPAFSALDGRTRLAQVLEAIADAAPRVVGVDVILADPGDPASDAALADALALRPTVIAAAGNFGDGPVADVLWPQDRFAAVADVALVNLALARNGTPRYLPMLVRTSAGPVPSFAVQVAARAGGAAPVLGTETLRFDGRAIPLDLGPQMPLRLAGPAGTVPTLSAGDLLAGQGADILADRAVILGYTATAFGDRFPTPFDADMPGVEIMAGAVAQLLGAPGLRRDAASRRIDAGIAALLAAACTAVVLMLPLSAGLPLALGLLGAALAGIWLAFGQGLWLSAALPLAAAGPPVLIAGILRHLRERRAARQSDVAARALRQFQSPALADLIAADPGFLARPEARDLSVFFIDISGFTQLSEALGPDRTQDLLKAFHMLLTQEIEARRGIVLNYMGDGALAVFGMQGDANAAAEDALGAGFTLIRQVPVMTGAGDLPRPLACRVGLHAGPVMLSRLGGAQHQQVSVAGDSVNLASRLLEVAKDARAQLAVTADLIARLQTPPDPAADQVTTVAVRGRDQPCDVHLWRQ